MLFALHGRLTLPLCTTKRLSQKSMNYQNGPLCTDAELLELKEYNNHVCCQNEPFLDMTPCLFSNTSMTICIANIGTCPFYLA